MALKVGDVVRLNSGGPAMTIQRMGHGTDGTPTADCVWFEENKVQRDTFPLSVLTLDE